MISTGEPPIESGSHHPHSGTLWARATVAAAPPGRRTRASLPEHGASSRASAVGSGAPRGPGSTPAPSRHRRGSCPASGRRRRARRRDRYRPAARGGGPRTCTRSPTGRPANSSHSVSTHGSTASAARPPASTSLSGTPMPQGCGRQLGVDHRPPGAQHRRGRRDPRPHQSGRHGPAGMDRAVIAELQRGAQAHHHRVETARRTRSGLSCSPAVTTPIPTARHARRSSTVASSHGAAGRGR